MWPVDDPPKGELHTTFMDAEGKSVRFTGPANVAVIMHMTRAAAVTYEKTKADYAALPAPTGAVTTTASPPRTVDPQVLELLDALNARVENLEQRHAAVPQA